MWHIERTETFKDALKTHKKNKELIDALDKKITRLQTDPHSVGGKLSGELHPLQSTRLVRKYRLLFRIDETTNTVYLTAIDHRGHAYD